MKKVIIVSLIIIAIMVASNMLVYSDLPTQIASHWDAQGNVNGQMGRFWGTFLLPIMALGLLFLFWFLPKMDPYKQNYKPFEKYYQWFVITLIAFIFYIHLLTLGKNLGYSFNLITWMIPGFSILLFVLGMVIGHAQRNWFVGIRTPWTLSSEKVWNRTHQIGGKLFMVGAIISLLGMFFPSIGIFFFLVPIILIAIFLTVYSYWLYKKG